MLLKGKAAASLWPPKTFNEDPRVYCKSQAHGFFLLQLSLRHFEVGSTNLFVKPVIALL